MMGGHVGLEVLNESKEAQFAFKMLSGAVSLGLVH